MKHAYRTLLAENDASSRMVYETALRQRGHEVKSFTTAGEAWEACQRQSYDIAILAWGLPGMHGQELCPNIRKLSWGDQTVIVMVTEHDRPDVLQQVFDAGADDYLAKPISMGLFAQRITIAETRIKAWIQRQQSEKAQRKDEEERRAFHTAISVSQIGMTITDLEGRIQHTNVAEAKMHGYEVEEMIGCEARTLAPPELAHPLSREELLRLGRRRRESTNKRKDGSTFPVRLVSDLVTDPHGEPIAVVTTCEDITEWKRAQDELELRVQERTTELSKLKDFSEGILSSMTEGVVLTDSEGLFSFANPAAATMLGYQSTDQLIGQSWKNIVPSDQIPLGEAADERRARGESDTYDLEFLHTDGHRVPCQISGSPRFEQGQFAGAVCVVTNLTERKESEAERVLLSTAIDQASDGVVITDVETNILYVNPAFEQMTGYTQQQAIGQTPAIFRSGQHEDEFYEHLWRTLLSGETWKGHFLNKKADGTDYEEDTSIFPVTDESGKITHFVGIKRDVTEEMLRQRKSQHASKMETLGELSSSIAHDFNNLLTIIQGSVDLLQLGGSGSQVETIEMIDRTSRSAAQLTRSLLAFSRQQVLRFESVELNDFVAGLLAMLRRLLPDNVDVEFRPAAEPCGVKADRALLEQILFNICNNSGQAMPDGGKISLQTSRILMDAAYIATHPWAKEGFYSVLNISDEGVGMDEETCKKVLDPFFTTKEPGKGTGLGLTSAYGTIKQHGGILDIESKVGIGTTVVMYLPSADVDVYDESPLRTSTEQRRSGEGSLLVVEDLDDLRAIVAALLESEGYDVRAAANGVEALDVLRSGADVDLVITDVDMPGMGGKELYRRSRELFPKLRFIFCSGIVRDWERLGCGDDPRATNLEKPFDLEQLAQSVHRALTGSDPDYS